MISKHFLSTVGACSVLFFSMIAISSCEKEEPNDPTPDIPFYIQFDVNGSTVKYIDGENEYGNGPGKKLDWTAHQDSSCCTWAASEYTLFSKPTNEPDYLNNSIIVEMVELFNDSPSFNERFNIWALGQKNYGMWSDDSISGSTTGASFTYTDDTGKVWSSGLLFGVQDSSSAFEVTAHKAVTDELFNAISQGTFSCKFHDGSGNSLNITNGEFKSRTIQDL
ncbi:MAG: hypothetical protein ACI9FU_001658 [Granulosicoccus sp.]|jgi:hypothetical protein